MASNIAYPDERRNLSAILAKRLDEFKRVDGMDRISFHSLYAALVAFDAHIAVRQISAMFRETNRDGSANVFAPRVVDHCSRPIVQRLPCLHAFVLRHVNRPPTNGNADSIFGGAD